MTTVIVEARSIGKIVGMLIVDEVSNFLIFLLIVFGLVLVVDFGFDIEESIAAVATALSAMTLCATLANRRQPVNHHG